MVAVITDPHTKLVDLAIVLAISIFFATIAGIRVLTKIRSDRRSR